MTADRTNHPDAILWAKSVSQLCRELFPDMEASTNLDLVRIFAEAATHAKQGLDIQIREARKDGHSLRAIAEAADLSYETVRRICAE